MNIRPLFDNIVLRRVAPEKKIGSLYIPEAAQSTTNLAEVIAVGRGKVLEDGTREPVAVKPGDTVIVSRWAGSEVEFEGVPYLFCREDVLLGIVPDDEQEKETAAASTPKGEKTLK